MTLVLGNGTHKHRTPILPEFLQYLHGEREREREREREGRWNGIWNNQNGTTTIMQLCFVGVTVFTGCVVVD